MKSRRDATRAPRLLFVEDSDAEREPYADLLRQVGYEVVEARDVPEALSLARATVYDAALVDFCLPGGTGADVIAALRERGPATRIIVLTGFYGVKEALLTGRAGADYFLGKPATLSEMLAVLRGEPEAPGDWQIQPLDDYVEQHCRRAVEATHGNVRRAARELEISPGKLYRKLRR